MKKKKIRQSSSSTKNNLHFPIPIISRHRQPAESTPTALYTLPAYFTIIRAASSSIRVHETHSDCAPVQSIRALLILSRSKNEHRHHHTLLPPIDTSSSAFIYTYVCPHKICRKKKRSRTLLSCVIEGERALRSQLQSRCSASWQRIFALARFILMRIRCMHVRENYWERGIRSANIWSEIIGRRPLILAADK